MKRGLCLLLCLLALLGLAACGGEETPSTPGSAELNIPDVTPIPQTTQVPSPTASAEPDAAQEPTPSPEQTLSLDELWDQVEGFWTYGDEFFVTFREENGTCYFNYANWYSEFPRNDARATELRKISDRCYQVGLYYDACSDAMYGELDAMVSSLTVDLGPAGDNRISVQVESGNRYEYTYAGSDMDEALARIQKEPEQD